MSAAETSLWPFVVYFIAVLLLVATMLGLSWVLGQRRANKATNTPFESGVLSVGSPQIQMSVEFYLVAIFFVIFDDGDEVAISTQDRPVRSLFVSGKPIGEPVAWYGPIVMNTEQELDTAFREYQEGTFIKQA